MNKFAFFGLVAAGFLTVSTAFAANDAKCTVAESEWVGKEAVTKKLEAEGWKVRKVKMEDGCYEAYALKNGERAEVFLNPKTLEIVRIK